MSTFPALLTAISILVPLAVLAIPMDARGGRSQPT